MTSLKVIRHHALRTTTPDGRDLVTVSGIVVTDPVFHGKLTHSPGDWVHEKMRLPVPSLWNHLDDVVPMVL